MRKRIFGQKFSRGQGARRALYRSLVKAFIFRGSIETSKAKAKTTQKEVEQLVNMAKAGSNFAQKRVFAKLGNDKKTTKILFEKIMPVLSSRTGGYTRIINLPRRRGDAAEMARIEWVEEIGNGKEKMASGKSTKEDKKKSLKKGKISRLKNELIKKK